MSHIPLKPYEKQFDSQTSRHRFVQCIRAGLLKHAVPAESGGLGDGFADLIASHEKLGRDSVDSGLILSINAHLWGALFPVLLHGADEQRTNWLPGLLCGQLLGGHAITEPHAGSDIEALQTIAEKNGDNFILNGCKRYITNTPIADLLIVYARLENRLSAFIVHKDDPGVCFTDHPSVTGCPSAPMGDVTLENCTLPASRQLGRTGAGGLMIQQALELERAFIFAGFAGIMDWQLREVIHYSRERISNKSHLGRHQAISHKIADMKLRLDTVRLWVGECARLRDNGKRISMVSAQTKLFAGEAFLQSSLDAVQILGAGGMLEGSLMAQLVNDAMASRLFSGSSEIQKNIIAALLGTGSGFKRQL